MDTPTPIQGLLSITYAYIGRIQLSRILNGVKYTSLSGKIWEPIEGIDWEKFVHWLPVFDEKKIFPEINKRNLSKIILGAKDPNGLVPVFFTNKFCTGIKIQSDNKRLVIEINLNLGVVALRWSEPTIEHIKWIKQISYKLRPEQISTEWDDLMEFIVLREVVEANGFIKKSSRASVRISESHYALYAFPGTWKGYKYIKALLKTGEVTCKPVVNYAVSKIISYKTLIIWEVPYDGVSSMGELKLSGSLCFIEEQIYCFPYNYVVKEFYASLTTVEDLQTHFGCKKVEVQGRVFYLFQGNNEVDLQDLAVNPYRFDDKLIQVLAKKFLS